MREFDLRRLPDAYLRTEREDQPNWAWLDLWEQANPNPGRGEDFDAWYAQRKAEHDRVWVAWCLPQFSVFDWSTEDVAAARKLVAGHVCGVCGRPDDPGCSLGC